MIDLKKIDLKKLDFGDCIKFDKTLNNFTKYNMSVANSSSQFFNNEDEFAQLKKKQELLTNDILSKIKDTIRKDILNKYYYQNTNYDAVDIRDNMFEQTRKLSNAIIQENKPSLITCGRIAADLSDSAGFNHTTKTVNGSVYKTGSLLNTEIFVDPYIRFSDNRIIFFDKIGINIIDLEVGDDYYVHDFRVHNDISFNLAYNLDDVKKCKVLYIIDNDNQDALHILKARKRDEKLNDLLNGEFT